MRRGRRSTDALADDSGSAPVEFIVAGLLLLVPLVYLIVTLGIVQGHAMGADAGARHIARALASAADESSARGSVDRVMGAVAAEYGMDAAATTVSLSCSPAGGACPRAGAHVVVSVRTTAQLPLVPPVLGLDRLARIPIEATAVQKVSRFWGSG